MRIKVITRFFLSIVLLGLTGCGIFEAVIGGGGAEGGEGAPCSDGYECEWFNGLSCDEGAGVCVPAVDVDTSECENAHEEFDNEGGYPVIFDVFASTEVTSPVGDVTRLCLFGSVLVGLPPEDIDSSLNGPTGDRLIIKTDASNEVRPDGDFQASYNGDSYTSFSGEHDATYLSFQDCWQEAAGFGDIPEQFAVQVVVDGDVSNAACVSIF